MKHEINATIEFHKAFGLPCQEPGDIAMIEEVKLMRKNLVNEETKETIEALDGENQTEIISELTDIMYVIAGSGAQFGITGNTTATQKATQGLLRSAWRKFEESVDAEDAEATEIAMSQYEIICRGVAEILDLPYREVFDAIHAANMRKLGPNGEVLRRESDNKILKPKDWQPADIKSIVRNHKNK